MQSIQDKIQIDANELEGATAIVGPGCNDFDAMARRLREAARRIEELEIQVWARDQDILGLKVDLRVAKDQRRKV